MLVAATSLVVLMPRLSEPMLHADEMTYMISVVESLHAGSFWPLENGRPFVRKPPLGFWLIRLSFQWLGPTPFAARLPAALATAATAGVLYLMGAAWRSRRAGLLAAALFVLLPGPLAEHAYRAATFDALEILLVVTAIACLELWRRGGRPAAVACYLAALAFTAWAKSPFGGVVILIFLVASEPILRRRGRTTPRFARLAAASVAVWLAAVLLWLAALVARSSLQSVAGGVIDQQYVRRIEGRLNPLHLQGPGFYARVLWGDFGALLLVPLAASAARLGRRRDGPEALDRGALVVWALAAPILVSFSDSKLPRYAYASYPGLALLVAADAERLAAALVRSRAVSAALLGALVAWSAWRLPARRIWPSSLLHRGPSVCLYDLDAIGARLVQTGPLPLRRRRGRGLGRMNAEVREARLFLDAVLWQQKREPPPDPACVGHVVSRPSGGAVVLLPAREQWGPGMFLVDACGGRLRERLLSPRCGGRAAPPASDPQSGTRPTPAGTSR